MGDGGVDQTQEFTLGFRGVIHNLLRDICQAKHDSDILFILNITLFDLDKCEAWNEFILEIFHAFGLFDNLLDIDVEFVKFIQIVTHNVFIEYEHYLFKLRRRQSS